MKNGVDKPNLARPKAELLRARRASTRAREAAERLRDAFKTLRTQMKMTSASSGRFLQKLIASLSDELAPVLILMSDFGHFDRLFATMTEKFERRRSLCPRASEARRVSQDEKRGIRSQLSLNFLGAASSFEVCFTTGSGSGSDTPKNPERLP
jgi:hypothetical protein